MKTEPKDVKTETKDVKNEPKDVNIILKKVKTELKGAKNQLKSEKSTQIKEVKTELNEANPEDFKSEINKHVFFGLIRGRYYFKVGRRFPRAAGQGIPEKLRGPISLYTPLSKT